MFKVGKPVEGKYFYDRSKMLVDVKNFLQTHQDFMIKAPRRYGKTSLIKQAIKDNREPTLYLDFRKQPRLEKISNQILDFAYAQAGVGGFIDSFLNDAFKLLRESKQSIKINTSLMEYSVEFLSKAQKPCDLFLHALDVVNTVSSELKIKLIIIMDEFQDIKRFKCEDGDILELLRGTIQHHENITYCFLGSIEHIMTQIFENKKSSFYNFCRKLKLLPFETEELVSELVISFKSKGIVFDSEDDLTNIVAKLSGHPSNTMMVMQNIYYISLEKEIKSISKKDIDKAYENAFEEMQDLLDQYIVEISNKKNYYDVLYRLVRKEKQILDHSALGQVYKGLMNLGYLLHVERGVYELNDGFLREYIERV